VDSYSKSSSQDEPMKAHLSISDILKETSFSANKSVTATPAKTELDAAILNAKQNKRLYDNESDQSKDIELKKEKDRVAELENKVKEIEEKAQADKRDTEEMIKK